MLWSTIGTKKNWSEGWRGKFLTCAFTIGWSLLTFMLITEGFFFEEFQSRFNTVAVDYLIYPHEVFVNIWESYHVVWIIVSCLLLGAGAAAITLRTSKTSWSVSKDYRSAALWFVITILLGFSVGRSESHVCEERSVNELASNTFSSLLYAASTRNLDYAAFYPTMDRCAAFRRTKRLLVEPGEEYTGNSDDLWRHVAGDPSRPKLNVCLLLEESLGSEFWGALGRKEPSLMPQMDEIATKEGWLFDNIYADGNRTIRGYEGVFSSFPPLPGDSIVARDRTKDVETIAQVLDRDGYETMFVYAGRGVFDGTGKFAQDNGWKHFLELKDFKDPAFTTVWGVCNEDLYDRLLIEMRQYHDAGKPFLMTSMSVSNHKPYSYPAGRIPEAPNRTRTNVVKYTDYALAKFFEKAKREPFWKDTIFVVVGDHGARVYGSQTIPIRSYEIPFLVLGPAVADSPQRISTLGCQMDVMPTVLGMIGRPYDTTFFGHDLLKTLPGTERVLLNHNRSVGIYQDERLVVFNLNRKVEYFAGNPKCGQMKPVPTPDEKMKELEDDATAIYQSADDLYMNRRFTWHVRKD
ncbi:MAG TPA: LTA synthase family protein [Verrucomicrobiae bacterium]